MLLIKRIYFTKGMKEEYKGNTWNWEDQTNRVSLKFDIRKKTE
jgi:hypothetical protein